MTDNKILNEIETKVNTEHDALAKLIFEKIIINDRMSEERKQEIKQHLEKDD